MPNRDDRTPPPDRVSFGPYGEIKLAWVPCEFSRHYSDESLIVDLETKVPNAAEDPGATIQIKRRWVTHVMPSTCEYEAIVRVRAPCPEHGAGECTDTCEGPHWINATEVGGTAQEACDALLVEVRRRLHRTTAAVRAIEAFLNPITILASR